MFIFFSCEIIRDWKTGASLQYAFIEFETTQACEQAFFKMENVLLDERRIHVDFSQSVSKIWHKSKKFNSSIYSKKIFEFTFSYKKKIFFSLFSFFFFFF